MNQAVTIKCPGCNIGMDIELIEDIDPIFTLRHLGNSKDCPNCDLSIHVTIDANKKNHKIDKELPF